MLVFKKNKEEHKKNKILFIDASDQVRVGRAQNFLDEQHVQQIFTWYTDNQNIENYTKVVDIKEVEENDYNLNIPLYIDKIVEDNLPLVEVAMQELKDAWSESLKAENKFIDILQKYIK